MELGDAANGSLTTAATTQLKEEGHGKKSRLAASDGVTGDASAMSNLAIPRRAKSSNNNNNSKVADKSQPQEQPQPQAVAALPAAAAAAEAVAAEAKPAPTPSPSKDSYSYKLKAMQAAMSSEKIDRKLVEKFVFLHGSPDCCDRGVLWKLCLGYLPWDRSEWAEHLKICRQLYADYVAELTVNPYQEMESDKNKDDDNKDGNKDNDRQWEKVEIDPLGAMTSGKGAETEAKNKWSAYFKDNEIRDEIEKDIERTYATFSFFQQLVVPRPEDLSKVRTPRPNSKDSSNSNNDNKQQGGMATMRRLDGDAVVEEYTSKAPQKKEDERHCDVIKRILFIFAKLNPGIKYVQGMNEILAPLYFVFAKSRDKSFSTNAEADAFFTFTNIMSDIRDRFIKSLDSSSSGVIATVNELNHLLRRCDPELWAHLDKHKVDPRFYSFRWLTLMLSQEFELPDVLRLWDSFFADRDRYMFLNYICVAMLVCVREEIMAGTFNENLQLLQRYPPTVDIQRLLSTGVALKRQLESGGPVVVPRATVDRPGRARGIGSRSQGVEGGDKTAGEVAQAAAEKAAASMKQAARQAKQGFNRLWSRLQQN